jgi:hypothetical protein
MLKIVPGLRVNSRLSKGGRCTGQTATDRFLHHHGELRAEVEWPDGHVTWALVSILTANHVMGKESK